MQTIKTILILLAVSCLTFGCEKEMMSYQGNTGVYFAVQHGDKYLSEYSWPYQPNSIISFFEYDTSEITYPVRVKITGPVEDFDRYFNVEINPDSTTAKLGVHYTEIPSKVTVPAGATMAYVNIHLLRAKDLENTEQKLGLRLVPNEYFQLSFPDWHALPELTGGPIVEEFDASLHTLYINDFLVQPAVWFGSIQQGNMESGAFGAFTRNKLEVLNEVMGLTYSDFASSETMPLVRARLISTTIAAYLKKRYDAGNPVLEDDGRLMWIEGVPWKSYLGIPWVPGS